MCYKPEGNFIRGAYSYIALNILLESYHDNDKTIKIIQIIKEAEFDIFNKLYTIAFFVSALNGIFKCLSLFCLY